MKTEMKRLLKDEPNVLSREAINHLVTSFNLRPLGDGSQTDFLPGVLLVLLYGTVDVDDDLFDNDNEVLALIQSTNSILNFVLHPALQYSNTAIEA
jgi:hypothetical protein